MTTLASGRCTSAPVEVESDMGMNPKLATKAVISTGRDAALPTGAFRSRRWARLRFAEASATFRFPAH